VNNIEFTLVLGVASVAAGLVGALTGLGGGVVLVPMLTVFFGVDIKYAIGASLVSVIATSSGAAAAYVREGYSNVRVGMFLEMATTFGALAGAFVATQVAPGWIAIVFGVVLLASAYLANRPREEPTGKEAPDPLAVRLRMDGTFPTPNGLQAYHVHNIPGGSALMFVAGLLSGLLGIGSGALKVLAMDQVMRLPFKVSTTTSNFMIGVTAAASAGIYLSRGYIDPRLALPVVLGVLVGALLGARLLTGAKVRVLRIVFTFVLLALAVQMIVHGVSGDLGG
jgi:uncharacterized membrane protein YfcA